jgi:hypothetical protein
MLMKKGLDFISFASSSPSPGFTSTPTPPSHPHSFAQHASSVLHLRLPLKVLVANVPNRYIYGLP